jgi:ribosomal protein L22
MKMVCSDMSSTKMRSTTAQEDISAKYFRKVPRNINNSTVNNNEYVTNNITNNRNLKNFSSDDKQKMEQAYQNMKPFLPEEYVKLTDKALESIKDN